MDRLWQDLGVLADNVLEAGRVKLSLVPGSSIVRRYIASSYQHDPVRSFFELLLLLFAIRYFLSSKYSYSKKNYVELNEREIDELVAEWQPEPLVKPIGAEQAWQVDSIPIVEHHSGPKVRLANAPGREYVNLATPDVFDLTNDGTLKERAIQTIREYGVGSCGPAGFYGNQDAHVECEQTISQFLGTEGCILYAQGLATVTSVIPCFLKRGDIIVADKSVNLGIQKGMLMSRASLYWYNHNDMADLEQTLIKANKTYTGGPLPRRFIVTEGVYENNGNSPDLVSIVKLKDKYKYRLLLDETYSLGILGATGRGLPEEVGIDRSRIEITLGSLAAVFGSAGGFCAGRHSMVEHQRITSLSYTFSATMPPYLATNTTAICNKFDDSQYRATHQQPLREKSKAFHAILAANPHINLVSRPDVPTQVLEIAPLSLSKLKQAQANPEAVDVDRVLQDIVDLSLDQGVLITRLKRVEAHEIFPVTHAIKIYVQNALPLSDLEKAAEVVSAAFTRRFS
ncbi:serine palmitoyltransferase 1 [Trichomonascus vanleenenianus]|uniref:serine C-palmitoyltransferase LCB1 n=1 Tax=Trichomonascus vanleenenianus TaxID=2268995 RepID=UPI003EC990B6